MSEGEFSLEYGTKPLADDSPTIERLMMASPLTYDGKYIYAISSERNTNDPKVTLKYALEVYELKLSTNTCSFVRRVYFRNGEDGPDKFYLPNWTNTYESY